MPVVLAPLPTPPDAHSDDPLGLIRRAAEEAGKRTRMPERVKPDPEPGDDVAELTEAQLGWTAVESAKHPRWPKGTPGGLGGEFMHVGQTFDFDGKTWEVSSIVEHPDGSPRIIAHEASGKYGKVETREFDPAATPGPANELTGATRTKARKVVGGKKGSDVTIVDPYVDPKTHDPAIPIPPTSDFTAEEWKRFGRAEQLHYTDLQKRYGKHGSVAASNLVKKAYAESENETANLVSDSFNQQYGASTGFTLSITGIFKHLTGSAALEQTRLKREKALELQGRIRDAYAWDLYNRLRTPDVAIFHKDGKGHATSWWKSKFISGGEPVFSGLSQSHHFRSHFWSQQTGLATPTSIRHVVMATVSAPPLKSGKSHFDTSEKEMAIGHQMKVDERSMSFHNNEIMQEYRDWLEGQTEHAAGGDILDQFRRAVEEGEYLPIPPPKPHIQMGNADAFQPPAAAGEAMAEYGEALPGGGSGSWTGTAEDLKAFDLPWLNTDDNGVPVATTAEEQLPKLGDFVMGQKGTLYWVGPDNAKESPLDLRLYKLIPDGAGGLKYNNESFAYSPGHPNYVLKGNVPLPKTKEAEAFDPEAWVPSEGDPVPIVQLNVGDKFKVNGTVYEISGAPGTGQTQIKDLEHGGTGTVNSGYQALPLVPKPDYVPAKQYLAAKKGLTLAYQGKKHVVTSVKKDGTVSIKPSTGGTVVKLGSDAAELTDLFDPKGWKIGDELTPLSNLKVGDIFHGGRGKATARPHRIESIEGNVVNWTNLDTGEAGQSKLNKKVKALVPTDVASTSGHDNPPGPPEAIPVPSGTPLKSTQDMVYGEATILAGLGKGDLFSLPDAEKLKFQVLDIEENPDNGSSTYKIAGIKSDGSYTAATTLPTSEPVHYQGPGTVQTEGPELHHGYAVGQIVEMKKFNGQTWKAEVTGSTTTPSGKDALTVKKGTKDYTVTLEKVVTPADLNEPTKPDGDGTGGGEVIALVDLEAGQTFEAGGERYTVMEVFPFSVKAKKQDGYITLLSNLEQPTVTAWPVTKDYEGGGELSQALDDLPDWSDSFQAYKSAYGSGGKYKHNKLNEMPVGTVFQDKSGKLYKVQVAGPKPVITDGVINVTINGNLRGRALEDATMGGPPPPVATGTDPDALPELGPPDDWSWTPNSALAVDDLPVGSYYKYGGYEFKKVDHEKTLSLQTGTTASITGVVGALKPTEISTPPEPGEVPESTAKPTTILGEADPYSMVSAVNQAIKASGNEPDPYMTLQDAADHLQMALISMGSSPAISHALSKLADEGITPEGLPGPTLTGPHYEVISDVPVGHTYVGDYGDITVVSHGAETSFVKVGDDPDTAVLKQVPSDTPFKSIHPDADVDADVAPETIDVDEPGAVAPLPDEELPEEESGNAPALAELEDGAEFENLDGHPFKKVTTKSNHDVIYQDMQSGLVGEAYEMSSIDAILPQNPSGSPSPDYEAVSPAASGNAKALADNIEAEYDGIANVPTTVLLGYKSAWGSGGKYKHPHLKDLLPGQKFTDKGGNDYIYVQAAGGGMVLIYRPNNGKAFLAPGVDRVRELD